MSDQFRLFGDETVQRAGFRLLPGSVEVGRAFCNPTYARISALFLRLGPFESWLPPLAGAGIFRLALASACKFRRKRDQALDLS